MTQTCVELLHKTCKIAKESPDSFLRNGGRNPGKTEKAREEEAALAVKSFQLLRAMIHNERLQLPPDSDLGPPEARRR